MGRSAECGASWRAFDGIANPAHRLAAALASMKTDGDLDVAIDGFYSGRNEPTPEDEELVKSSSGASMRNAR